MRGGRAARRVTNQTPGIAVEHRNNALRFAEPLRGQYDATRALAMSRIAFRRRLMDWIRRQRR